jgi:hypothetical protein
MNSIDFPAAGCRQNVLVRASPRVSVAEKVKICHRPTKTDTDKKEQTSLAGSRQGRRSMDFLPRRGQTNLSELCASSEAGGEKPT